MQVSNRAAGQVSKPARQVLLPPGWRWSGHVRPLAGTELREAPHLQYHVPGTLHGASNNARA
jgi:hypothetical protein